MSAIHCIEVTHFNKRSWLCLNWREELRANVSVAEAAKVKSVSWSQKIRNHSFNLPAKHMK